MDKKVNALKIGRYHKEAFITVYLYGISCNTRI